MSKKIKYSSLFFLLLISLSSIICFSFSKKKSETINLTSLKKDLKDFKSSLTTLDSIATAFNKNSISLKKMQEAVLNTRKAFKKTEYYLAFYYAEYTNEHFNGAPLLHIEKSETRAQVIEPEGLQVLDELIFSEEVEENKNRVSELAKKVKTEYFQLYASLEQEMPSQNIIIALRMQLIRIYTLGLTGFDTPGSLNAIDEAKSSLNAINIFLETNFTANKKVVAEIQNLIKEAIVFLDETPNFESLDRLIFLKKYLDPIYKKLKFFQLEEDNEYISLRSPWNPNSTSLFDTEFLNPYYFTELKQKEDNPALRALGKDLFYDSKLSGSEKMNCASCHKPDKAFTDGAIKSISNSNGKTVLRNAPTLLNAVYADRYFYDLRAFTLEQQAEHVIFNSEEFNTSYKEILDKLNSDSNYILKFKKAFGMKSITRDQFSKALVSYIISLKSFDSEFDKYVRNEINTIRPEIKNGYNLFMGKATCATCHFVPTFSGLVPPLYTDTESEILGVLANPNDTILKLDTDNGRLNNSIKNENAWIYEKSFKTTTVRNAGITAPYFHNGAYNTLEDVIDFYNNGGGEGLGLKVTNQTLAPNKLNLTKKEKSDLILFIKSLNDESIKKQ